MELQIHENYSCVAQVMHRRGFLESYHNISPGCTAIKTPVLQGDATVR